LFLTDLRSTEKNVFSIMKRSCLQRVNKLLNKS
jgi:hypothetical protein